jgi:hypothetical protein
MDFLTFMHTLFDLKEKFPDLRWDANAVTFGESTVVLTIPVDAEIATMMVQASQMFAPVQPQPDPWAVPPSDEPPF